MEFTSPQKTEKIYIFYAVFVGDNQAFQWPLRSRDALTRFSWGTRLVLSDGRELDVERNNLMFSFIQEHEQVVVERTPNGLPASVVDIVNRKNS